jgi:4-deoxy-L-threo-5-hexosulose-uronate ketol-isomerase
MSTTIPAAAPALARTVHVPNEDGVSGATTGELRRAFLVEDLFVPGELRTVATDLDRLTIGAAMPRAALPFRVGEGREMGVLNIGAPADVLVAGKRFTLGTLDALYVGAGNNEVIFQPAGSGEAAFYFATCPAQRQCETVSLALAAAESMSIGDAAHANERTIRKLIAPGRIESCQLVMGFTELQPGAIWNTMPPHTHIRRSEIYLYFDLEDGMVVHLMGLPGETRHLIVRDRQAVLSPPWSIHAGAGTRNYRFAWVMAGENQDFGDIDPLAPGELK